MRNKHIKIILYLIAILLQCPYAVAQPTYATHSRLASGSWFKIPVTADGVYIIRSSDIAELSSATCSHIAMFGSSGDMLSESNRDFHPDDLEPLAIKVVDKNGNGFFDSEDYILFYGESANTWRYRSRDDLFEYNMHAYATANNYFITPYYESMDSTMRLTTIELDTQTSIRITTYTSVATYHVDNYNTHGGGQTWVADKFGSGISTRNYTLSLPDIPSNGSANMRYGVANVSERGANFTMRCGNNQRQTSLSAGMPYIVDYAQLSNITNKDVQVSLNYAAQMSSAEGYLDFIEINAQMPLKRVDGQQFIRNSLRYGENSVATFEITGNCQNVEIWDIDKPSQPRAHTMTKSENNTYLFSGQSTQVGTFVAFSLTDAKTPSGIVRVENQDIHGSPLPDYVIVTHKDFIQQAHDLADLHQQQGGMNVLVVTQDQVFNEFSSGKADALAVRQMMRQLRSKDSLGINPRYLLFFGKGTFDNRDILGKHLPTAITYQTPASFDSEGSAYPSDDHAGYLADEIGGIFEGTMSVSIGRLPAKTQAEATHMVNKIEGYMTKRDLKDENIRGDWRNYVTFLADDADPSCPFDTSFASDSEKTAQLIKNRFPHMNIDRIFADSYIQQSGADGSYYPDVNNALRQRMNYGCLLFNYIGHGSSSYIGTERFMEFPDIEKYTNYNRLPLIVASTCSWGHYDLLDDICGAEAILLADAAGIGVVSAARPIHHNFRFDANNCLFALDPENTIGDALRKSKNITQVSHCISLMGDPALRLSLPRNKVVVTSVNNRPVNPDVIDSAEVLSRVTIEGEIQGADGSVRTDFNGTIFPIVFDREVACRTLANDNDSTEVNFFQQKNMLYKGREAVTEGRFSYSFIIPRDVAYHYDYAKLSHYARNANDDATGQYGNIMFGGFNEEIAISELHPTIELYINDTNFRDGGITNETPTLYARLIDSVGINAAGSGLGHDITAIIDHNPYSTINLNDYFEPSIHDSRNGEIYYTLGKLDEGPHTLTVKGWNIFNYSGSATISFVVVNDKKSQIGEVTAAPNPAHDRTMLRIEHNMANTIDRAEISIYDIRGALVKHIDLSPAANACVLAYPWDFTAENGSQVARGIYIMRAKVTTLDGEQLMQTAKIVRN